jgi:two-component system response regulator NreC
MRPQRGADPGGGPDVERRADGSEPLARARSRQGRGAVWLRPTTDPALAARLDDTGARRGHNGLMAEPESAVGTGAVNVVIADDHGVVRGGLRLLLHQQEDFHVIGEAEDIPGTLRLVDARRPDVLVLDLNMPGPASIDAIPEIRTRWPGTRIVVLTMQDDPSYARAALQAGADGYVLKESAESELVHAVREVARGGTYLNPALGARMARTPTEPERPDDLTEREVEVLRLIALGHTNGEIGSQLYLSVRTVETHRAHIQQKIGVATRAELVRYALDRGLIGS